MDMQHMVHFLILGYSCLLLTHTCEAAAPEYFHGSIDASQNLTFKQQLGGKTKGNYSTVTWSYNVTAKYESNPNNSAILYFRHVGQEAGYGTDMNCFGRDLIYNLGMDGRLVSMIPFSRKPGIDKECVLTHNKVYINCKGSLNVGVGVTRQWYASIGLRCNSSSVLDVPHFNITVTPFLDGEVECTNWTEALNGLDGNIFIGWKTWVQQCSHFYEHFSRWNLWGLAPYDYINIIELEYAVITSDCYKHLMETSCRSLVPECKHSRTTFPCKEVCVDFNKGCATMSEQYMPLQFNISCTSLTFLNESRSKTCVYEKVLCSKSPTLRHNVQIKSQNGSEASSVARVKCSNIFYNLSKDADIVCGYNGRWHNQENVLCEAVVINILILSLTLFVVATIALAFFIRKFRFELKLLMYKYFSCLWYCCCYFWLRRKRNRNVYDAFIAYEREQYHFVKRAIHEPLKSRGFNICVDYENITLGSNMLNETSELIHQSARVIFVLNQDFLDEGLCQLQLEQALMQSLEDASFGFILVLMQDRSTLKRVPRWLKSYLRTKVYIAKTDPFFMSKLLHGLPFKPGNVGNVQDQRSSGEPINSMTCTRPDMEQGLTPDWQINSTDDSHDDVALLSDA